MPGGREVDFKEIMQNIASPSTRTPAPGVMKYITLIDTSLVIITLYSVCLI